MKRIIVAIALLVPIVAFASDAGVDAGVGSAVALPDVNDAPAESASFVWKLYKGGHLVPAIIVGLFFALALLQRRVAWFRVGWRKLLTASLLAGLGMLAERLASGTTPNLMMVMGAFGAALAMWIKTEGEAKAAPPVVS